MYIVYTMYRALHCSKKRSTFEYLMLLIALLHCSRSTEAAVESLLRLLGESAVILDCEHPTKLPHIISHTEEAATEEATTDQAYEVLVENVTVVRVASLTSAVLAFGMLFLIFNKKTHRSQQNVNWFLRTHVLCLPCERKPSAAAAKAVDELELQAMSPRQRSRSKRSK